MLSDSLYAPVKDIQFSVSGESDDEDWVGIYLQGDSNGWGNVTLWDWASKRGELSFTLEGIPAGDYEARFFFRNSFELEAKVGFSV